MQEDWLLELHGKIWKQESLRFTLFHTVEITRAHRPREAPYIWCPRKPQNPPSNPHAGKPQIRTFGQRWSCDS